MVGQDISALSNGATLSDRDYAYIVWGVDDKTHDLIGTSFNLDLEKKGNQELEDWLRVSLSDNAEFDYVFTEIDGVNIGILSIRKAIKKPVSFQKVPYIRSGSNTKKLSELPALQEKLWSKLNFSHFEDIAAVTDLTIEQALQKLNYSKYFDALGISIPSGYDGILHYLSEDGIIRLQDNGQYSITNLGSILFSKKLSEYPSLFRKVIRVVSYEGTNRLNIQKETIFDEGYALCLDNAVKYIDAFLPSSEVIDVNRHTESIYPISAIREALANACIHQEMSISGSSILVEIFSDRIEITNPGKPLVAVERIVDNPPKSRNEKMSSLMRRMKMCEELGSGWDRMVISCELKQLPAPKISIYEENTKVTLFGKTTFGKMTEDDRLWSCYLHACVKYVQDEYLTNSSLRERFGLSESSSANVSRLIKEAINRNLIKPIDKTTAPRYMKYIPVWA